MTGDANLNSDQERPLERNYLIAENLMTRKGQSCTHIGEKFFRQQNNKVGLGLVSLRIRKNGGGKV